jgi:acyl carrier protein
MEKSKLSEAQIIGSVKSFLKTNKPGSGGDIGEKDDLFKSGVLDSLLTVALISHVEKEFNISLGYEDLSEENLSTLSSISQLVSRKAGEA